jgi:uncharacterized membrane protein YphA (DoxX/SURF4 family)
VTVATRWFVGLVLLVAGVLKAGEPSQSAMAVAAYDLVPAWAAFGIGFLLPGLEIAVGAALVTGFLARSAAMLAAALSAMFLIVIATAKLRGLDIACGCFGRLSEALESDWTALLDVAMLGASIAAWREAGR